MFVWRFLVLPFCFISASQYQESTISKCLWHKDSSIVFTIRRDVECVDECPEHLIIKSNDCDNSYWPAQRTCKNPETRLVGTVCGFSRCDCPGTTVLDTETGYCYDVDNCPTIHDK